MVIPSTKLSGGIPAPTISVFGANNITKTGWKSREVTSSLEVIEDRCGNASDIKECIVQGTYNLSDVVKYAHIGFRRNESLMGDHLWQEDFTHPFYGRLFTINPDRRITPDYDQDQIFLHLQPSLTYTIYIYAQNFFVLNTNILSFPVIIKYVSTSMESHYWNLAVTEIFEFNHPKDPCYEGIYRDKM